MGTFWQNTERGAINQHYFFNTSFVVINWIKINALYFNLEPIYITTLGRCKLWLRPVKWQVIKVPEVNRGTVKYMCIFSCCLNQEILQLEGCSLLILEVRSEQLFVYVLLLSKAAHLNASCFVRYYTVSTRCCKAQPDWYWELRLHCDRGIHEAFAVTVSYGPLRSIIETYTT